METSDHPKRGRSRIILFLLCWVLLVLALYGYRTHHRLIQQTTLVFRATLQGQPVNADTSATLDDLSFVSGQRVSIGRHTLVLQHRKADSFSTNLFLWYGEHNLGVIALHRAKGTLAVVSSPPAERIRIRGPEFTTTLTKGAGETLSVPADDYEIDATYKHCSERQTISVSPSGSVTCNFSPQLGALQLRCNQSDATYQLLNAAGESTATGKLPADLAELRVGNYQVVARYHDDRRETTLAIRTGSTNHLALDFLYGAAAIETEPGGVSITGNDGRQLGVTPITLVEMKPGRWNFVLQQPGYETLPLSLDIAAGQTNTVHTNLLSTGYVNAMADARRYLSAQDYDRTLESVGSALRLKPGDPPAEAVQRQASALKHLAAARALRGRSDYVGGIKELELALQLLPDNEDAKQLLDEYKKLAPEQIERMQQERLHRGDKLLKAVLKDRTDSELFDTHELKTTKPVNAVHSAVVDALKNQSSFRVTKDSSPDTESFAVEAVQEFSTALATSAGRRECVVVGAQTRDDETQILFKVLEYRVEAVEKFSIGALIGTPATVKYVPISVTTGKMTDKLQARLTEGVSNVTACIESALRQAPSPASR